MYIQMYTNHIKWNINDMFVWVHSIGKPAVSIFQASSMGEVVRILADANAFLTKKIEVAPAETMRNYLKTPKGKVLVNICQNMIALLYSTVYKKWLDVSCVLRCGNCNTILNPGINDRPPLGLGIAFKLIGHCRFSTMDTSRPYKSLEAIACHSLFEAKSTLASRQDTLGMAWKLFWLIWLAQHQLTVNGFDQNESHEESRWSTDLLRPSPQPSWMERRPQCSKLQGIVGSRSESQRCKFMMIYVQLFVKQSAVRFCPGTWQFKCYLSRIIWSCCIVVYRCMIVQSIVA